VLLRAFSFSLFTFQCLFVDLDSVEAKDMDDDPDDPPYNLRKMLMSSDGKFIYILEYDVGSIYTYARDELNGNVTLLDHIRDCTAEEDTEEVCEKSNATTSRFLQTATDMALSYDGRNLYVVSFKDDTKNSLTKASGHVCLRRRRRRRRRRRITSYIIVHRITHSRSLRIYIFNPSSCGRLLHTPGTPRLAFCLTSTNISTT
jgi:hypothetical protein